MSFEEILEGAVNSINIDLVFTFILDGDLNKFAPYGGLVCLQNCNRVDVLTLAVPEIF